MNSVIIINVIRESGNSHDMKRVTFVPHLKLFDIHYNYTVITDYNLLAFPINTPQSTNVSSFLNRSYTIVKINNV